jgi:hypothetical protein
MADNTYGLPLAADLIAGQTVEGMDVEKLSREQLRDAIDARLAARNRAISLLLGQLSAPTLSRGGLIGQHAENGEWPKATELSRGERRKTEGLAAVGFPIIKFGPFRTGWTHDFLAKASNTEILIATDEMLAGHLKTNYLEALRALYSDSDFTWSDDLFKEDGAIKVKPLLNGDSSYTPPEWQGNTFAGTETNYMFASASLDESDIVAMAARLRAHGYGVDPSVGGFGGVVVCWINSAQRSAVEGHTNYVAANDPIVNDINKIHSGGNVDNIFGYNKSARVFFKEVPWIPSGYPLMFVTSSLSEGTINRFAPLRRRVPTTAALQGIKRFDEANYPLVESHFQDFFGYGVANRLTAVCMDVANGSYTAPTIS